MACLSSTGHLPTVSRIEGEASSSLAGTGLAVRSRQEGRERPSTEHCYGTIGVMVSI